MITTTRNATLPDLLQLLQDQHARKLDIVAPAHTITSRDGILVVKGAETLLTEDGVTTTDGRYVPTAVCDGGISDKLGIPVAYLRRMRESRTDLYDANVNGWLHGRKALGRWVPHTDPADPSIVQRFEERRSAAPADPRSFLLRSFRGDQGETGIARALLSDRYNMIDNLDVLMATLDGVREAGVTVDIAGGDLTDRRMVVRVHAPQVTAQAPRLLAGYRSPFTGESGTDNPTVFAGFKISNSETGGGAFSIVPEVTVLVCKNGMTITRDAMTKVHVGGKLETGVVNWSETTQTKALELVRSQTADAVRTFLSGDYLERTVQALEVRAGEEVSSADAVKDLTKPLGYTQEQIDGILGYFVRGGQMTRGGVVNAITAYAQEPGIDGDAAYDLSARATTLLGV